MTAELSAQLWDYLQEKAESVRRYSQKLRDALVTVEGALIALQQHSGMSIDGPEIMRTEEYYDSYATKLAVHIRGMFVKYNLKRGEVWDRFSARDAYRPELKAAVKKLPELLQSYAQKLEEEEGELKELAEIAEKMAQSCAEIIAQAKGCEGGC